MLNKSTPKTAIRKCSFKENLILKFLSLQKYKIIIEAKKNL